MSASIVVEKFAIGQSVRRVEDPRLVQGLGRYSDDVNLAKQAYAFIVRSPHAHARIRAIDVSGATKAPGVVAVLTGADYAADKIGNLLWHGGTLGERRLSPGSEGRGDGGQGRVERCWEGVGRRARRGLERDADGVRGHHCRRGQAFGAGVWGYPIFRRRRPRPVGAFVGGVVGAVAAVASAPGRPC